MRGVEMEKARFVGVEEKAGSFTLKRKFNFDGGAAVLRVTVLGVYFVTVNGKRADDSYLAPGWTNYRKTLQMQEYDLGKFLTAGENTISLTVGGGWYYRQGAYSQYSYGDKICVCAELVTDNGIVIYTDKAWEAEESYIRFSSIYDGERQDFVTKRKRLTPVEIDYDKNIIVKQICEPVRNIECLAVKQTLRRSDDELIYDFGQNISGVVEIKIPEHFCGKIELQFAEILVNGNFYTENLREAKSTDIFIVNSGGTYSAEFTYHGFRYVKIVGAILPAEAVTAIVRHTDMRRTGWIEADNDCFDRLMKNIVWGLRGNFVDIPTDCPQRDERLGWTGDVNAFCRTASFFYDIRGIMRKWLVTVRDEQGTGGEVAHIAPDVWGRKTTAAFWTDAITMVPWALYQAYGDSSFLTDNYEAMKRFISAREKNCEDGLVCRGFEFGDWLAPDNELYTEHEEYDFRGRTDVYYIANIFQSVSLGIVAETANILGKTEESKFYSDKKEQLIQLIRKEYFTGSGRLCSDTVTAQTLALYFGIVPEEHRGKLAKELNANVLKHNCRIATGFIGTPFVLFALADNGYFETAERMLFNHACPSWLYEVDMGATTIWERWDGLLPDGTPNPDGMNSYNHYAYGAVAEFVYRRIAGIEALSAGYANIEIRPHPCAELSDFRAEFDSPNGKIVSGYKKYDSKIVYDIEVPKGINGSLILPNEQKIVLSGGKHSFERNIGRNNKA